MKELVVTKAAFKDLRGIWTYIAADNIDAADVVAKEMDAAMRTLTAVPGLGHRRSDVKNPTYRFWKVYSYLIAYRVVGERLYISRVVHEARDMARLFNRPT